MGEKKAEIGRLWMFNNVEVIISMMVEDKCMQYKKEGLWDSDKFLGSKQAYLEDDKIKKMWSEVKKMVNRKWLQK